MSLKEKRWWPWGPDQAGAPRQMKEDFVQAPALCIFSDKVGAVLTQKAKFVWGKSSDSPTASSCTMQRSTHQGPGDMGKSPPAQTEKMHRAGKAQNGGQQTTAGVP